ncbi:hypothetical protein JL721_4313 [Aureococcus anophagefferens]|nr:hypothetical protein JL721_4313 [Aureococcus anophagefferens]
MAKGTDNHSTLGLASRHALDATRVDDQGRKALHRFSASYNVIEVHPEAAKEVDHRGWLPLNHYCRGLGGDYDDFGDDVERHLGTLEERRAAPFVGDGSRPRDRPGDPEFFETCESLADVRKEYKAMLLTYHPDKNIGDEDEACRQMQRLQDAYAVALKKFHKKRPLEEAVASGDVAQVLASVGGLGGEDVRDFVDAEGNTLLHLVCTKCVRNVAADQLAAVVRLNPEALKDQNQEGDTPLHCLCACHRSPTEFEALVGRFAGRRSVGALEKLLAAFPAGAAHADAFDWTPLHLFAQFQIDPSLEGLNAVLAACPEAAARTTIVDNDTPLHLACYAHRRKISAGAALTLGTLASFAPAAALRSCKQGRKPWDHLPSDDPNYGAATGAIFRAVVGGLDEVCLEPEEELRRRSFLEKVLRNFRDSSGGSLPHVSAGAEGAEVPLEDVLRVADVLGGGAAVYDDADADGRTPLHRAAPRRRDHDGGGGGPVAAALVAALLEASPGAAARADRGGKTPLHLAASLCDDDAAAVFKVRALLGVAPESAKMVTGDGAASTAAHLACASCARDIGPAVPDVLALLAKVAPKAASAPDGHGKRAWDYLPRHDGRFDACFHALLGELIDTPEALDPDDDDDDDGDDGDGEKPGRRRRWPGQERDAKLTDRAGNTPLHNYVSHQPLAGDLKDAPEELGLLLEAHGDAAGAPNRAGLTPLHLLVASQKPAPARSVFDALVRASAANPESKALASCQNGDTAVSLLCRANAKKIADHAPSLVQALVNAARKRGPEAVAALFEPCERGLRPWENLPVDDPRFAACAGICLREVLADDAAKTSTKKLDKGGRGALHLLASRHGQHLRRDDDFVRPFFANGNAGARMVDDAEATPLHLAAQHLSLDCPQDLAFLGALVDAYPEAAELRNKSGWTPLHHFVHKHAPILKEPTGDGKYDIKWAALDALLDAGPGAVGGATSAGDSPLHLAAHAFRKSISPAAPHLLDVLVSAAPDSAARAVRQRGKASKTPLEWLPRGDARYGLCEELLSHKVARCLELLLEHHGDAASHVLPETGELALHQVCAITPPVATVRMLVALLANHAPAAATPRKSDGKTPLHLLCRAVTVDRDHYVPPPRADGGGGDDDESADSAEEDFADEDDRVGVWRLARGAPRLIRALLEYAPEAADAKDGDGKLALDYLPRQDRKYDACAALFAVFSAFARHPHLRVPEPEEAEAAADDAPPSPPSSSPPSSSPTTPTRSRRDTGVEYRRTPSKPKGPSVIIVGTLQGIPEKSPSRRRSSVQIVGKVKGAPTKSPAKARRMSVNALFDENTTIPIKRPVESPKTAKGSRRGSRIVDFGQGDSVTFEDDLDPEDTPTPPPPPLDTPSATPSAAKPFVLPDSDGVASPRKRQARRGAACSRRGRARRRRRRAGAARRHAAVAAGRARRRGGVGSPPCADASRTHVQPDPVPSRATRPRTSSPTARSPTTKPRAESFSGTLRDAAVDVADVRRMSGAPPPRRFIVRVIWRLIGLFVRGGV